MTKRVRFVDEIVEPQRQAQGQGRGQASSISPTEASPSISPYSRTVPHTSQQQAQPVAAWSGRTRKGQLQQTTKKRDFRPWSKTGGQNQKMAGFGQAPVFGAQALSADATNRSASPFGAPSSSSSPFGQPQAATPFGAFGAPAATVNNHLQEPRQKSPFAALNNATTAFGGNPSSDGGGFGSTTTNDGGMKSNPFATVTTTPAATSQNPFATQSAIAPENPFANAAPTTNQDNGGTANPFASAATTNHLTSSSNTVNGAPNAFGQPPERSNGATTPFASFTANSQKRKNGFRNEGMGDSKRFASDSTTKAFQKPQTPFAAPSASNFSGGFGIKDTRKNRNGYSDYLKERETNGFAHKAAAAQTQVVNGQKKSASVYAKEIHDQIRKDHIKPPQWPKDPGNPANRKMMEDHGEKYKKYAGRVRTSLIKAGLIDDPNVRKKLSDAIDFKGICEDMCPEGEKVSRIVEYDVKAAEKIPTPDGLEMWPNPDRMVKSFKRSAAGTDSPLPTEVRSPAALRRTLDYLIDDLLQSDENLPFLHNFLWDRTRAIRKDFIFQNAMSPEERTDQIYCLENIARFHAVALHLLSQEGFAAEDFSEQQEREQLGKTLLSLMQVYDECKDMKIENEAEFRAYYLLFNAHDPFVMQQMQDWNDQFWFKSSEVQTVVALIEAMQNVWNDRGPLRPQMPLSTGSASFNIYFSIVEDPKVSYTMACFSEIHFTEIRRHLLKVIHKAYGRVRDGPKDLTANVLNNIFRFDTEEQCVAFLEALDMEFSSEGADEPYLIVERRRSIPGKTVRQTSSGTMVERKRGGRSLPEVIHTTVFEDASSHVEQYNSPDSLFVEQSPEILVNGQTTSQMDVNFSDEDSPAASPAHPNKAFSSFINPPSINGVKLPRDETKFVLDSAPRNPFSPLSPNTLSNASVENPALSSQPTPFSFTSSTPSNSVFKKPAGSESEAQPPTGMPKPSWPTTPAGMVTNTATATEGLGSAFGFSNKPAETPKPPLFSNNFTSNEPTTSSVFSNTWSATKKGKAVATQASPPSLKSSAIKTSNAPFTSQESHSAAASIFSSTSAGSTLAATPYFFGVPQSSPTFPATQQAETAKPPTSLVAAAPRSVRASVSPPQALAPPKDLLGDFTRWVVLGDNGLMDEFQEALVEHLARGVYDQFQKEDEERRRKVEEEESWKEARKFRKYSLRVKYFYRWRDIARKMALKRIGRQNRAAMKAFREAKIAEARATKTKAEKEEQARLKRLTAPSSYLEELEKERALKRAKRDSMSLGTSRRSSFASSAAGNALLATGIFSGLENERGMAAQCVRDDDSIYDALMGVTIHPNPSQTSMGPPAKPKDPLRSVRNAAVSKPSPKPKLSKKAQYLADLISGKHREDDLISFRSSTSSRLGRSAAAGGKVTNFSRYQSSSPRSSAEPDRPRNGPGSGVKSSYWLLRSRGLFATPTGHILSDKAPRPVTEIGHGGGSQYSGASDDGDFDDRVLEQDGVYRASLGMTGARRSTFSVAAAGSPPQPGSLRPRPAPARQSLPAGFSASALIGSQRPDGDAASQVSAEGSAISTLQHGVEESLRELKEVGAQLDEETSWYRQQNRQLAQSQDAFGA